MNSKQAKQIPLPEVLEKLGFLPKKRSNYDIWYLSPFREEKTPSFKVNTNLNTWYDFGEGAGGNILDLFMGLYQVNLSQALKKVSDLNGCFISPVFKTPKKVPLKVETPVIQAVKEIYSPDLIKYLEKARGININLARLYLSEVHYQLGDKKYFALGQANVSGGFELRNKYFKGAIGKKNISHFLGSNKNGRVAIFEGVLDFLSLLSAHKIETPPHDVIILNSVGFLDEAINLIKKNEYTEIHAYFDNDKAGDKAYLKIEQVFENIADHRDSYKKFNDINEYWLDKTKRVRELNNIHQKNH